MRLRFLFLILFFLLTYDSKLAAQDAGFCGIDEESLAGSPCDTEGGYFSDEEVIKVVEKNSLPNDVIHKEMHGGKIYLYFFYTYDCPHCKKAHGFLEELKKDYPELVVKQYEVKKSRENFRFFEDVAKQYGIKPRGIPSFFVGDKAFTGYYKNVTCSSIIREVRHLKGIHDECPIFEMDIPMFGTINVQSVSLPSFTFYIGLLDGINPCAMWVLMFLLSLMVYAKDRKKIILLGGIFVLASGGVYFAFMAAWLNLFFIIGYSQVITIVLGCVAIIMGLINVKELFFFKKCISLMIPESAKPKLHQKARKVIYEENRVIAVIGTIMLAIFVNFIELGCTIGLPAIYTRILSVKDLPAYKNYLYMALYNLAYIIPLVIIVGIFAYSLEHFKFKERHGKAFKVISGILMIALGILLIVFPELLIFS